MKLEAREVEGLMRDAARWGAVLLHGDDPGLIRQRARRIVVAAAGAADDPFRVVEISGDDAKRAGALLASELATLPLGGGRRVVWMQDAADTLAVPVQAVLGAHHAGLLVMEAGQLTNRSKLRATVEKHTAAASVACYVPEAKGLVAAVAEELRLAEVTADADALAWLAATVTGGLDAALAEARKVALYVGVGGRITLAEMRASAGDAGSSRLDELFLSVTAGALGTLEAALQATWSEGVSPVAVLRGGLLHFQRLRPAVRLVASGVSASEAVRSLRPPVFYKQEPVFNAAMASWSPAAIDQAVLTLWQGERACKMTGAPGEAICSRAVWQCAALRGGKAGVRR